MVTDFPTGWSHQAQGAGGRSELVSSQGCLGVTLHDPALQGVEWWWSCYHPSCMVVLRAEPSVGALAAFFFLLCVCMLTSFVFYIYSYLAALGLIYGMWDLVTWPWLGTWTPCPGSMESYLLNLLGSHCLFFFFFGHTT